jgi:di/tricarboxylate transporter
MSWEAWFTGLLVVAMVAVLAWGRYGPDIVMMGAVLALALTGIIEPKDAVRGFASDGVITVAMLYIVAAGLRETGAVNILAGKVLGRPKSALEAQARLVLPVTSISAFMNNTPLVAMFLPTLGGVAKRARFPAAKIFMPLSFASILGGVCTLIGTSTNVVVAGLIKDTNAGPNPIRDAAGDVVSMGMFTITWVGLPIAVAGVAYILLFGRKLLPDRAAPGETFDDAAGRDYHTSMRVAPGSPIVGRSVEAAGLRHLPRLFLSRIERGDETLVAVGPDEVIQAGDVLVFVGAIDSVLDLQQIRGLVPVAAAEEAAREYRPNLRLIEAVVSTQSAFVGETIRDSGIRTKYGAVVVAVHRQGQQLTGKIGEIRLRPGDTLLMEAAQGFVRRYGDSKDFYLATERTTPAALRHERAWLALGVLGALVLTLSFEWLEPMLAAMAAAGLMILLRCCTGPQARASLDWPVLVVIGASFGIGRAMQDSGLAEAVATSVVAFAQNTLGLWSLMPAVYLLTLIFTAMMSNNAAAVLMFPITLSVAQAAGLNPLPFLVALAVAASCEFSTPIGYQTNMMVQGPGGYKWLDYTRFGLPLTLLCGVICCVLAPLIWPLQVS